MTNEIIWDIFVLWSRVENEKRKMADRTGCSQRASHPGNISSIFVPHRLLGVCSSSQRCWAWSLLATISSPLTTYTYITGLDDRLGWQNGGIHWGKAVIGWLTLPHVITPHSHSFFQKPQTWLSWEQAYRVYSKYNRSFNRKDETHWIFSFWDCELLWRGELLWGCHMSHLHGITWSMFAPFYFGANTQTHIRTHSCMEIKRINKQRQMKPPKDK